MRQTHLRWLSLLLFLLLFSGINPAFSAEEQIYTVKKGDTLWGISQRFIDDPYYWPNVWAKNPDITNPHLIFPGQKIRILDGRLEIIPTYTEAVKPIEEPVVEVPEVKEQPVIPVAPPEETVTIKTGGSYGFILTSEESLGLLVDSVDNRILLTKHDIVYLKMNDISGVTVGDIYGLFKRGHLIEHPLTGQPVGVMMQNLGFLQVTEINGETVVAKIGGAYREIERGAELFEYIPPPREVTLQRGTTDHPGHIVAARDEKDTLSTNDIIFVDMGSNDGLLQGNLLYLSRLRKPSVEMIKHAGEFQLPDAVLGAAIVIETKANSAAAIIIKSVDAAHIGDIVSVVTD